jgi:predicted nucleotidyltransferase|tara:strand:- start:6107 stop:6931 length:825 start_codon:yes stop_codon:yes gene_type:complete
MTQSDIDIRGRLPLGLIEMYRQVITQVETLGIPYFVVGAMARDLVLHHGFGAPIDRATRDIDFAIQVEDWESFNQLKGALRQVGFISDDKIAHRLFYRCHDDADWILDVLPFGSLTDEYQDLSLPPDGDCKLSMMGFSEAASNAWSVLIADDCTIPVVSPWGMVMLKLIAWGDSPVSLRAKDAQDIAHVVRQVQKVPAFYGELYDGGYAETCGYDNDQATALLLGARIAAMATLQTRQFIEERTLKHPHKDKFIRDMGTLNAEACVERFCESLL